MEALASFDVCLFVGGFRLHRRDGELLRQDATGAWAPVEIGTRALDVLDVLIERRGELVSRDEIMRSVWPGTTVEEHNLSVQISTLRRVLDKGGSGASCIKTVAGRGYRFVPAVTPVESAAPRPVAYSLQDRRLSVIVLPFENGGDPTLDNTAAAITRDLHDRISEDRSKDRNIPLIPAGTASAYRGKTLDLHAIGRDHDVHFALTGNVRRQDGRLVVSATLYETADVRSVWSQRFDRPDNREVWDSWLIVRSIIKAMMNAEAARAMRDHPDSLDKRDLMCATVSLGQGSEANLLARIALSERALALDPNYVWALEDAAINLGILVLDGFSSNRDADLVRAMNFANRALQLAPNHFEVLRNKAIVLRARGDLDEAAALLRKVIELVPQWGWARRDLGQILLSQGHYKEALAMLVSAKPLILITGVTGVDPIAPIDSALAMGLLVNDRFPEAIAQARLAIGEYPPESGRGAEAPWLVLIAAESANGQDAEARADLQKFLATPRSRCTMAEVHKFEYLAAPQLLDGLRRAGMPAE